MRLSHWQSFNPVLDQLHSLQSEMNQLFQRWNNGGAWNRGFAATYPAVNVWESEDSVHVEAELPGLDPKDIELHVTSGNQLTLKGERKQSLPENGVWHRQERGAGSFVRVLTLPFSVSQDRVDARFENGILLVKLPKHEDAKPRKIVVKSE